MKNYYLLAFIAAAFGTFGMQAESVYSEPPIVQETTQGIKVYFDATGSAMEGLEATTKVYTHTGVYTNLSPNSWAHTTSWAGSTGNGSDTDKYQLTYQAPNIWMLYIDNIRDFYGITNPEETVTSLNFVFKTAGSDGTAGYVKSEDLFIKVFDKGLQVMLTSDSNSEIITGETGYVNFNVYCTEPANITLSVDGTQIGSASNSQQLQQDYTFTTPGEHNVIATATAGGETAKESMTYHYLGASMAVNYPGGTPIMGPVANEDGSVTFCLGATDKKHVVLVGSWNDYAYDASQVMTYQDTDNGRYFWTTVSGLDPDQMYVYYFLIDGGEYIVGDPYARLVLDPNNDKYLDTSAFTGLPAYPVSKLPTQRIPVAIYQGTINDYEWNDDDWFAEGYVRPAKDNLVIYELLFRDFTGTEGQKRGNGTVKLALEKMDYLKSLGVNVIELLPICEFNGNVSWGYNPNFYFAPDKAYGTPDDYKEFIDVCHQNGIAVVLDMVFNQTDWLHPWYQMYKAGSNPYYNADAPHAYSVLNDINQGNPMIREQWTDVIKYWMEEYHFDGYRFDLVKGLGTNESYPNNSGSATNQYNASRVELMAYLNSVITSVDPEGYCINENLAEAKEENEMAADGELNWAIMNDPACEFAMGYPSKSNLNGLYSVNYGRTKGSTVSYLESHDEQRLAYKQDEWGVEEYVKGNVPASMRRLGSAAAQMLMTPGSHMIWMFSEMGNAENTKEDNGNNNTGPKIVNWSLLDEPNHKGLYDTYCTLMEVRNANPELFSSDVQPVMNLGSTNWGNGTNGGRSIYSTINGKELITIINPNYAGGDMVYNYDFTNKDNEAYNILVKSYGTYPKFDAVNGTVTVPVNSFVVIGSAELPIPAAIDGIQNDSYPLNVWGADGEVVVGYAPEVATVYSLDGKVAGKVAQTGSVKVAPGLYIVKSGKESVKVIVK